MASLQERLDRALQLQEAYDADKAVQEVRMLFDLAQSDSGFNSQAEFEDYLTEGVLLNVNTLGSRALSIPCGEYIVWNGKAGNALLIPSSALEIDPEVYTKKEGSFEIHASKLISNWNRLEKSIAEEDGSFGSQRSENPNLRRGNDEQDGGGIQTFGSDVDNTQFKGAMERADMTMSDVADACDVDVSTISRMLRDKREGAGDPKGRLPSIELATRVADAVGTTVDNLGFTNRVRRSNKKRKATGGSGTRRFRRAAAQKWSAGNG